jgi:hypothetical protein
VGDLGCDKGIATVCKSFLVQISGPQNSSIKSADLLWQQFKYFGDICPQRCVCLFCSILYCCDDSALCSAVQFRMCTLCQSCIPSMHAIFTPDVCLEIPVSSSEFFLNRISFSPHHHYSVTRKCTAPPSLRVLRWLLRCV